MLMNKSHNWDIPWPEISIISLTENRKVTWDKSVNHSDISLFLKSGGGVGNFFTYKTENPPISSISIFPELRTFLR